MSGFFRSNNEDCYDPDALDVFYRKRIETRIFRAHKWLGDRGVELPALHLRGRNWSDWEVFSTGARLNVGALYGHYGVTYVKHWDKR